MKRMMIWIPLLLFALTVFAQEGIERLNFFPDADAYLQTSFSLQNLHIETPQETVNAKEARNYSNGVNAKYGHRFSRRFMAAVEGGFEWASENAVIYNIPFNQRIISSGPLDPSLSGQYRLRNQSENKGLIDAHFFYTPPVGPRKIAPRTANRLSGRSKSRVGISHGYLDEQWEFRNNLGFTYIAAGSENNEFLGTSLRLEQVYEIDYSFTAQYQIDEKFFFFGGPGIVYRSNLIARQRGGGTREIRTGTASRFLVGGKRKLSEWTLIQAEYILERQEYFVKSETFNLNGDIEQHEVNLHFIILF